MTLSVPVNDVRNRQQGCLSTTHLFRLYARQVCYMNLISYRVVWTRKEILTTSLVKIDE